jgi:hypothetical protein
VFAADQRLDLASLTRASDQSHLTMPLEMVRKQVWLWPGLDPPMAKHSVS